MALLIVTTVNDCLVAKHRSRPKRSKMANLPLPKSALKRSGTIACYLEVGERQIGFVMAVLNTIGSFDRRCRQALSATDLLLPDRARWQS